MIRSGGDGEPVHMTGGGDVAARDGDGAAAAARSGRRRSKVGAVERNRQRGSSPAGPEISHVHVHLATADRLPRDLAVVVVVRRQRETRGVQDWSSLSSDQDPRLPPARKLKREAETCDVTLR